MIQGIRPPGSPTADAGGVDRIGQQGLPIGGSGGTQGSRGTPATGPGSFADVLRDASGGQIQVSRHAARRLEERGIALQDEQVGRLRQAMDTLAEKGGRTSLVMLDSVAYVVHVPTQTVVTAVKPDAGKENVFTQIDSVVVA